MKLFKNIIGGGGRYYLENLLNLIPERRLDLISNFLEGGIVLC